MSQSAATSLRGDRQVALPTPFHARTAALCQTNEWVRWSGYTTVDVFDDVELEYFAIRNQATLFDISPLCKYAVSGKDAEAYMNRLVTRDIRKLKPGRVTYAVCCDDDGQVIDDGTVFRFSASEFRICCQEHLYGWLTDSALGFEVEIEDVTDQIAGLALQGPTSCALLEQAGAEGIAQLRPFALSEVELGGLEATISRTGFTGDLGYELWVGPEMAVALWDRLWEAGRNFGIRAIGAAALELARIEAGFIMTKADFLPSDQVLRRNRGRTPFELGLERLVDFDKGHFTGRRALLEARRAGPRTRLVGLEIDGNKPAAGALVHHAGKKEVGHVTSALWSPTCKRNLALATLTAPYGASPDEDLWVEIYSNKELKWDRVMVRCRLAERPFFNPPRRARTPPGDF